MKQIPLKNQYNIFALVDDEDYNHVMRYKSWRLQIHGGHAVTGIRSIKIHWLLLECPDGMEIDHIDHNPLNNQKSNLRVCLRSENCANRRRQTNNTTGYKGVSFNQILNKYAAYNKKDGTKFHLGLYTTAEEAALVYDKKAKEAFGDFAFLNFPDKDSQ